MLYSVRAAPNLVADTSLPVIAPLAASPTNAAPFTVRLDAVAMVKAALLARLSIVLFTTHMTLVERVPDVFTGISGSHEERDP